MLEESLLVISFCDYIYQDVILLPEALNLVVLDLSCSSAAMECYAIVDILLLCQVVFISVSECYSKIVQHVKLGGILFDFYS